MLLLYAWWRAEENILALIGFSFAFVGLFVPFLSHRMYAFLNQDTSKLQVRVFTTAIISSIVALFWFGYWWFDEPTSTIFVAVVGIVYMLAGLMREHNTVRIAGLICLGYVVGKLYLYDIWEWSTLWKFVALLPIGLLLISLPFWYQKLKKD